MFGYNFFLLTKNGNLTKFRTIPWRLVLPCSHASVEGAFWGFFFPSSSLCFGGSGKLKWYGSILEAVKARRDQINREGRRVLPWHGNDIAAWAKSFWLRTLAHIWYPAGPRSTTLGLSLFRSQILDLSLAICVIWDKLLSFAPFFSSVCSPNGGAKFLESNVTMSQSHPVRKQVIS